ncbi:MAG: Rieske 2Fe-2S domain-containing protein, partial [Cyanobacteria bacterium J06649_4]
MGTQKVLVCRIDELGIGEMKQFTVAGKDVLLVHTENGFSAIAPHCSHYGAPLKNGVLHNGRVVCPWHNACFSAASGKQLNPPGRDNLNIFATHTDAENVYVELPESITEHIPPTLSLPDSKKDQRHFVIIGGGAAGEAAAQMFRQTGFQGQITLLTADSNIP